MGIYSIESAAVSWVYFWGFRDSANNWIYLSRPRSYSLRIYGNRRNRLFYSMGNIAKREIIKINIRFYTIDLRGGAIRLCPTSDQRDHLRLPGNGNRGGEPPGRGIFTESSKKFRILFIFSGYDDPILQGGELPLISFSLQTRRRGPGGRARRRVCCSAASGEGGERQCFPAFPGRRSCKRPGDSI